MSERTAQNVFTRMAAELAGLASGDWSRLVFRAYLLMGNPNLDEQAFVEDARGGRIPLPPTEWRGLAHELRSALCEPEGWDRVSAELIVEPSGRYSVLASSQLTQTFGNHPDALATFHRLAFEPPPVPEPDSAPPPVAGPPLEADFAALVTSYSARYAELVGTPPRLQPPATEAELAEVEETVALPAELRALYRITSGGDLFGTARLLPPAELVEEWRLLAHLYRDEDYGPVVEADPPGTIRRVVWSPGWIPFATWGDGDSLVVDLDPGPAGRVGQIILIGREHGVEPDSYVAPSIADLFTTMLRDLDEGRYEADPDNGLWITIPGAVPDYGAHTASLSFGNGQQLTTELARTAGPQRIQELYLLDAPELDLSALAEYGRLIMLRVLRCGRLTLGAAAKLPLELLEISARSADLSALAGHPTLRSLTVHGLETPIELRWLADLPHLETLDLSGSMITGAGALAQLPRLQSLTLDRDHWVSVPQLPAQLTSATMVGGSLEDAVGWANRLAPKENTVRRFTGTTS